MDVATRRVTEGDAAQQRLLLTNSERAAGGEYVRVDIALANIQRRWAEIVFPLSFSIEAVKEKVCRHTGLSAASALRVYLRFSASDCPGTLLNDNSKKTLKDYGCVDGCILFVEYQSEAAGEGFAAAVAPLAAAGGREATGDLSGKYVMSDEAYDQRQRTMRKFLQQLKQHQEEKQRSCSSGDPPPQLNTQERQQAGTAFLREDFRDGGDEKKKDQMEIAGEKEKATKDTANAAARLTEAKAKFVMGLRCRLVGDRRGEIAFVGPRPSRPSHEIWIGVALDEPLGSTNGCDFALAAPSSRAVSNNCQSSVQRKGGNQRQQQQQQHRAGRKGVRLFDCKGEKYGEFALVEEVEVGDFPPLDPFDLIDEI